LGAGRAVCPRFHRAAVSRITKARYNNGMNPRFALPRAILIAILLVAAVAVPVRAQAQLLCRETFVVRPGDTLYDIAVFCGVPYLALLGINYEISDPNNIYPGQIIRLEAEVPLEWFHQPASGPAEDFGLQPGGAYIVRRGDSLARIAFLYDTTIYDLMELN